MVEIYANLSSKYCPRNSRKDNASRNLYCSMSFFATQRIKTYQEILLHVNHHQHVSINLFNFLM